MRPRIVQFDVDYNLPVTVTRRGHDPVIPRGQVVGCTWPVDVHLYSDLEDAKRTYPTPRDAMLSMKAAGIGIVVGDAWHVPHLELMRARLNPIQGASSKHHLIDVSQDLYYWVAFRKGLFWARYDWIEPVDRLTDLDQISEQEAVARRAGVGKPA
jgi:hypothetical protein